MKDLLQLSPVAGKNKQSQVVAALLKQVRALGVGAKLPSMQNLCAQLQVAKATLDLGLAQLEARGFVERRHGSGVYVTPEAMHGTIGLVVGKDIFKPGSSPTYLQLMEQCGLQATARDSKLSFYIDVDGLSPRGGRAGIHRDLESALAIGAIDGLILTNRNSLAQEDWLREAGVPFVVFGYNSPHLASVSIDGNVIISDGLDILASKGCRSVAFMGNWSEEVSRFLAVADAKSLLHHHNWVLDRAAVWAGREGDINLKHEEIGALFLERILAEGQGLPDGIVCTDDVVTRGLCHALEIAGYVPGRDVQIVTHANKDSIVLSRWDGLVQFLVDPVKVAEALFSLLDNVMQQKLKGRTVVHVSPELESKKV